MAACNIHQFAPRVQFTLWQRIRLAWRALRCKTAQDYLSCHAKPFRFPRIGPIQVVRLVRDEDDDDLEGLQGWSEKFAGENNLAELDISKPEFVDDTRIDPSVAEEQRVQFKTHGLVPGTLKIVELDAEGKPLWSWRDGGVDEEQWSDELLEAWKTGVLRDDNGEAIARVDYEAGALVPITDRETATRSGSEPSGE